MTTNSRPKRTSATSAVGATETGSLVSALRTIKLEIEGLQSLQAMLRTVLVGAFDRAILVVATATGTGWIDPDAATAIEHLYSGNTAIVSMQYSYLPSWIAFLIDPKASAPAGSVLFNTPTRNVSRSS